MTSGYLHEKLLPENVFGHTKKVRQFRQSIERLRESKKSNGLRILDLGCGSGYAVTRFLARTGDDVLGVDMYQPDITYAQEKFGDEGLRFVCTDVESLNLDDSFFDVVVMADVLEHLDDPVSILATAARLLAPDGILLVSIPNGRGPFEIESALSKIPLFGPALLKMASIFVAVLDRSILRGMWTRLATSMPTDIPYNIDSGHVQFFSRRAITDLINEAGFKIVNSENISFLSGPFTNTLLAPFDAFCRWNAGFAAHVPHWLASAWFFECRKPIARDSLSEA